MNYVNLAIVQSVQRAREVGVRKVLGARRTQLLGQFLSESMLLVLISLPLALGLAALVLPVTNELTGLALSLGIANRIDVWLGAVVFLLIIGLGAGGYPAFVLSAFRPTQVFKGSVAMGRGRSLIRRGLLVFQFASSFVLVTGSLGIYSQLHLAILLNPTQTGKIVVRLAPGRSVEGIVALESTWETLVPDRPFIFKFLDDQIQAQYNAEKRLSRVFGLFAGLAIMLAALGLLGLAAFTARLRTKEIGIRKVLGATTLRILRLLTSEFFALVVVAIAAATPLYYLGMERWLEDFTYRIDLGPGILLIAGALAVVVALSTVGVQAFRAARANPADAIRYE